MIRFACPGCMAVYTVPPDKGGKAGTCPKCGSRFEIPLAEGAAAAPSPPPPAAPRPPDPVAPVEIAPCPGCLARLSVAPSDLGSDIECPHCKTVYGAARPGDAPSRAGRKQVADDAPPKRRPRVLDDDEDDDDYDRPRRRSRRRRYGRTDPKLLILPQAIILICISVGGIAWSLVSGLPVFLAGNPDPRAAVQPPAKSVIYAIIASGVLWNLVVLAGSINMAIRKNWGIAVGTSVIAIVPCSAISCCFMPAISCPVGVWALIVLMANEDVKRSFDS